MTLGVSEVVNKVQSLEAQYQALIEQFEQLTINQENWFNHSDFFNSSAFQTRSDELQDYFKELKSDIEKLTRISDTLHLEFLADKIAQEFACFKALLNAKSLDAKNSAYKKQQFSKLQKVKQFTKKITQSSQSLYQELSKLQEYERRLLDMVAERQQQLNQYQGQKHKTEYQQQVLAYQQRLGRCRQAISKVEEHIQQLDEPLR